MEEPLENVSLAV